MWKLKPSTGSAGWKERKSKRKGVEREWRVVMGGKGRRGGADGRGLGSGEGRMGGGGGDGAYLGPLHNFITSQNNGQGVGG